MAGSAYNVYTLDDYVPGKAERMARRDIVRLLRAVLDIKLINCLSLEFSISLLGPQ